MNVFEIMTKPVFTCGIDESAHQAAQRMWDCDIGALPVVNESGELVGLVTDRDLCMSAYLHGTALSAFPVREAMAKRVFSCEPRDSLEAAEDLMVQNQIRRIPVVDAERQPIGMVSLNDIARHTSTSTQATENGRALLRTLAAICQPRRPEGAAAAASAEAPREAVAQ